MTFPGEAADAVCTSPKKSVLKAIKFFLGYVLRILKVIFQCKHSSEDSSQAAETVGQRHCRGVTRVKSLKCSMSFVHIRSKLRQS